MNLSFPVRLQMALIHFVTAIYEKSAYEKHELMIRVVTLETSSYAQVILTVSELRDYFTEIPTDELYAFSEAFKILEEYVERRKSGEESQKDITAIDKKLRDIVKKIETALVAPAPIAPATPDPCDPCPPTTTPQHPDSDADPEKEKYKYIFYGIVAFLGFFLIIWLWGVRNDIVKETDTVCASVVAVSEPSWQVVFEGSYIGHGMEEVNQVLTAVLNKDYQVGDKIIVSCDQEFKLFLEYKEDEPQWETYNYQKEVVVIPSNYAPKYGFGVCAEEGTPFTVTVKRKK